MNKKYYIFVGNEKIEVDYEVYKSYWQITNRERYLERLDRQNKLLFFSDLSTEYSFEDNIVDKNFDVEKIVETKMLIDRVREAINSLNDDEREIIERLYYQDESTRIAAEALNLHKTSLIRKRDRILEKLRKMLEGNI
ncbi:hypothetical protein HMPREF9628_01918 [Peptoanaerobacter stomatis]|uniref:Sigma-70, region 4 n=1 Tax=Peptoanaerobacter stomatis TaxID=796937 RepID=G9XDP5_9FIRM|nr:sigma factor [Peptoanaerobacter stomatis]EHL18921.1 hypothetical protein HMPREF9628_01918 [Peptoanaerobacter stomatis]